MIVNPEYPISRPSQRSSVTKPLLLVGNELIQSPTETQNGLGQWSSETNLESKEEEKRVKLLRNHRSAGDMRNHFGLTSIPAPKQIYRANTGNDPLFFLDLTYEDSDEE
jgi:hypothetical protein